MMARRKKEPCEYCGSDFISLPALEDDDRLILELYPGHCISATAILYNPNTEEHFEANVSVPMEYCPVCGRHLGL